MVSAPLITTLVDASGLFLYLSVAKLLIAQLHGGYRPESSTIAPTPPAPLSGVRLVR